MSSKSDVRVACPQDAEHIFALCKMLHAENGVLPMNETKVRTLIERAVHPQDNGMLALMGVIGPVGGALEGMCAMIVGQMWYSDTHHIEELYNFVHPDHRRSRHAKELVNFMKRAADKLALPLLTGILSSERTEAKVRLYDRMLPRVGAFYYYVPPGPEPAALATAH